MMRTAAENFHREFPHFSDEFVKATMLRISQQRYLLRPLFDINPKLLEDLRVQKALADYEARQLSYRWTTDVVL